MKLDSHFKEIATAYFVYIACFAAVYWYSTNRLAYGETLYIAAYYLLTTTPIIVAWISYSAYSCHKKESTNWISYWRDRGFLTSPKSEGYEDDFDSFCRDYYSSERLSNRVSDAWETILFSIIIIISIISVIAKYGYDIDISINANDIISPLIFIQFAVMAFGILAIFATYSLCKILTNRYPGEARRARKTHSYYLLFPNGDKRS
ncbi:hypothetical protein FP371_21330 [Citrobacter freundii]|uniref:hypothetical protein n=1 Tax=Citrobacter freundii TaxID=546 RepID=UPI001BCB423E|nr:hypothetical protein [Citrobacter freundii]MBY5300760.1 hypothetical protein [Citrobacter freundii]